MDWKESLQKRQETVNRTSHIIETAERLYQEGMQEEGVLELGRTEDLLLRAVAETYRLPLPEQQPGQEATMLELLQAVETAGLLDEKDLKSLHELRQCRNGLAHASRNGCSLGQKAFLRIEKVLESTIPNLLCGLANGGSDRAISCMDDSLELIRRARQVAGKQAPEAAALRLGQALEIIVRASAGIVCPWVLVGREGESTLNDQINGLQQAGCYSEEEIRQLHAIQGLRNWAAHRQDQPMDGQAVEQAADWLEHFALGTFARLLGVVEAYAKELKNREQQAKEKEQDQKEQEVLQTIKEKEDKALSVLFWLMIGCAVAWTVVCLMPIFTGGVPEILQWITMIGVVLCPVLYQAVILKTHTNLFRLEIRKMVTEHSSGGLLFVTVTAALCVLVGRYFYMLMIVQDFPNYALRALEIIGFIMIQPCCSFVACYALSYFVVNITGKTEVSKDTILYQKIILALQILVLAVFVVVMNRPPFTPYW